MDIYQTLNKQLRITSYFGILLFLNACMVGPDYQKPDTQLPESWHSESVEQKLNAETGIEQTWWRNFNDPVLNQLIERVAGGNFDLKIAQARIIEARATHASARAALFPGGDMMASANRQANQIGFPNGGSTDISQIVKQPFDIFKTGFDASWELDLFGGHRRNAEAAKADLAGAVMSRNDMLISTLAETARTYVDIRLYQMQLRIAEDIVAADKKASAILQERLAAGDVAGFELARAISQQEQDNSQTNYYKNLLTQAEYGMDILLGESPGTAHKLVNTGDFIPQADQKLLLAAPAAVIANRPDVRIAERKLASATAQQGVALAKFFPDISLSGFIGLFNTNAANWISTGSKSWFMGGNVIWPILSYGSLSANLDAADARQQEALHNYQKSILNALTDVERAFNAYQEQEKYRESRENAHSAEQNACRTARERFAAGVSAYSDVLEAERKLYAAENQLNLAKAQTAENLIAVYKSLGGGWQTMP